MQKPSQVILKKLDTLYTAFGGKTIAFLAFALLIAMMTIFFSDNWILKIKEQVEKIAQARAVVLSINQLKYNVYKAESAQRGYLIMHDPQYLAPYDEAIKNGRANIAELNRQFIEAGTQQNSATQEAMLDKIRESLEAKALEMSITVDLVKSGKFEEAISVVSLNKGTVETDKIIKISDDLLKIYNQLLKTTIQERVQTTSLARASVIFGPLLLIFLVVLVIRQLLNELADKSQLQLKLIEINESNQIKLNEQTELLTQLALDNLADVERERHKLARELHDELGSILTATKMDISWVIKTLKEARPEVVEKLKKTSGYLDRGINFKRQIVQELHPPMIASFGFWPALKTMIEDAANRNEWQLSLIFPEGNQEINQTISLVAYRVIQETLNNCSKYAKANAVSVDILCDETTLKIEIQDNGIGMDTSLIAKSATHGIKGMKQRVIAIGGNYEITSAPDDGVHTRLMLPLKVKTPL
jgi:signal transduction histidine kinase